MADPSTAAIISAVAGAATSLFTIGEGLFGDKSSAEMPQIQMPQLAQIPQIQPQQVQLQTPQIQMPQVQIQMPQIQQFQIPQADLQTLNSQIQQNTQLSDTARQTAMDAINSYNQGQLSGAYAGQYEQQYNQAKQQVLEQLAAQGFTAGSTQYTNAMQNLQTWAANLKSQLLQQQLNAGLKMAGLSDQAINDLTNSWQIQSNINAQNNQSSLAAYNSYNQAQLAQENAALQSAQLNNQSQLDAANMNNQFQLNKAQLGLEGTNAYNQAAIQAAQRGMYNNQLEQNRYGNVASGVKDLTNSISSLLGGGSSNGSTASTNDLISGSNLSLT